MSAIIAGVMGRKLGIMGVKRATVILMGVT